MKTKTYKFPILVFIVFFVFILVLFTQYIYLSLSRKVYGIDMQEFASNRNTVSSTLYAKRGTIYDNNDNILALDVSSYTIVAYLDESRSGGSTNIYHVQDKEYTAKQLSLVLDMTEEEIYNYLDQDLYQTYLGIKGKNITEITKQKIEELNLPGIEFEENYKRYYPNGEFASYIIGYAKNKNYVKLSKNEEYDLRKILSSLIGDYKKITYKVYSNEYFDLNYDGIVNTKENGITTIEIYSDGKPLDTCVIEITEGYASAILESKIMGELGIESKYEETLRGANGYLSYQADRYGYKIPDTKEDKKEAENGSNIYLTLDSNIQRILESAVNEAEEKYEPEWFTINIMDAKTGDILGSASTPSYNPNDLNTITNYENPLTSFVYEPGSVMKIYTYMCAIEKGTYKGDEKYESGHIDVEGTKIYDWNRTGWGSITYDYGFEMSSNVGVTNMVQKFITKDELKSCLAKYGFGDKTNIELSRELSGNITFNYPVEVAAASYGQGIFTTPVQHLQALSIIANDGYMVSPHVVKKITNTGEITYEREINKTQVVNKTTTDKLKELMYNTVNDLEGNATGLGYRVKGLDVIGKTGTAEVFNSESGSYENGYIYSFAGMFPKENPEIIIFTSMNKPNTRSSGSIKNITQPVIESIAKYKGLIKNEEETSLNTKYTLENYINKDIEDVKTKLKEKGLDVIVLGDGDKIIKQYPYSNKEVIKDDKVFLITNGDITMPDLTGYTRIEAISLLNLLNVEYEIEGFGYVTEQSINVGDIISTNIKITLKQKHEL
ncbi:MAG: penicillin-binding protein [Bacilli bacterium]|nr:penicillin-binding protein [Bacilli bacterium]